MLPLGQFADPRMPRDEFIARVREWFDDGFADAARRAVTRAIVRLDDDLDFEQLDAALTAAYDEGQRHLDDLLNRIEPD